MNDYLGKVVRPRWQRWLPLGLLGALLLLGASIYRSYGMPWDDFADHQLGVTTASYVLHKLAPLSWQQRLPIDPRIPWLPTSGIVHGPVLETPAAVLGWLFYPNQPAGYYAVRHGFMFLVFVVGVVALYGLGQLRFRDWRWALLGAAILVLSPRFFAEAFYNGKDVGFMALFTLAMLAISWLAKRPTMTRALLAAAATAAAIGVRMPGIVLPALAVGWLVGKAGGQVGRGRWRLAGLAGLYLCATAGATISCWPYLWETPLASFSRVLGVMSHVPWGRTVLYWGRLVPAPALPWHYLPVWIALTTPVSYLLGAVVGLLVVVCQTWRAMRGHQWSWSSQLDFVIGLWLLVPLGAVIALQSVVFDGWRHMYFIYPALLLLAIRGMQRLAQVVRRPVGMPWRRVLAAAALVLGLLDATRSGWFIAAAYPNQQVYFSFLPAATAERLFERDYWGLSYRYGLEWLVCHDPSPTISVTGPQPELIYFNWLLLSPAQQQRLKLTNNGRARYYLSAYRWHPQSYADTLGPEVLAYRPGNGVKTLSIFRRVSLSRPLPPTPQSFFKPGSSY
jgi:hypothetical protein